LAHSMPGAGVVHLIKSMLDQPAANASVITLNPEVAS
jgi:hypothetical protein